MSAHTVKTQPPDRQITQEIAEHFVAFEKAQRQAYKHAVELGMVLRRWESMISREGFNASVADHTPLTPVKARSFMRLAEHAHGLSEPQRERRYEEITINQAIRELRLSGATA